MDLRIKILAILLTLSNSVLIGQNQSIFGDFQTTWNYISLTCDVANVTTYVHEKDTTIDNIPYHLINDWGLLRESDLNAKLWYRSFDDEEEFLLMDLSLNIGDTFLLSSVEFIVDTIYTEDSLKVIEFDYIPLNCGFYERLKFKEGKGPNLCFDFLLSAIESKSKLLRCHTKDSITINYLEQFGFGSDCSRDLVSAENLEIGTIQIFPNPFNDYIIVRFNDTKQRTIEIYNINGLRILNKTTTLNYLDINTEDLLKGVYIIRVKESDVTVNFKMIKE